MIEEPINLTFKFLGMKPVSTNDAYIPTARGKSRRGAFFRKSQELINWQEFVKSSFDSEFFYSKSYLAEVAEHIKSQNKGFQLRVEVSIPIQDYFDKSWELKRRDASNYLKIIEDSIYEGVGLDDRVTTKASVLKGYNEDHYYYIVANLVESSILNRIDVDVNSYWRGIDG